jgi:hypothetical protein
MKILKKKFYHTSGGFFTLIGLGMIGLSITNYMQPIKTIDFNAKKDQAIERCITDFESRKTPLNFKMSRIDDSDRIKIIKYGSINWESSFYGLSNVISNCNGLILEKLCFGSSCNIKELTGDPKATKRLDGLYAELVFKLDGGVKNKEGFTLIN